MKAIPKNKRFSIEDQNIEKCFESIVTYPEFGKTILSSELSLQKSFRVLNVNQNLLMQFMNQIQINDKFLKFIDLFSIQRSG